MTDYTNPDWLCIHKVINHRCKQCWPAARPQELTPSTRSASQPVTLDDSWCNGAFWTCLHGNRSSIAYQTLECGCSLVVTNGQASQPPEAQWLRNEKGEIVGAAQEAEIPKWAYDLAFQRGQQTMAEKAGQVGHRVAFEYLDMHRTQRTYDWHEVEDALTAATEAIRSLAGSSVLGAATPTLRVQQ